MSHPSRLSATILLAAALVLAAGCGRHLQQSLGGLANQRPLVRLESAFAPAKDPQALGARVSWRATDPDGRVEHYLVTEDVGAWGGMSGWTATGERERSLTWRRAERGAARPAGAPEAAFRFIAVAAVDDRGAVSEPAYRAFFDDDIAPTVAITRPRPMTLIEQSVPPTVDIRWTGSDPDDHKGLPAKYKYLLLRRGASPDFALFLQSPDSLRARYAPGFAGWDSLAGDSTHLRLAGLVVGEEYMFVITAIDAHGAYDPVFSLDRNVLRMAVVASGALGPVLTVTTGAMTYRFPTGGALPPTAMPEVTAFFGSDLTVRWYATPTPGTEIAWYRWNLDNTCGAEVRHRREARTCGGPALDATSVTITPGLLELIAAEQGHPGDIGEVHTLFIEIGDTSGFTTLCWVQIRYLHASFARDLLIVDDTRLRPDQIARTQPPGRSDSLQAPVGNWPTAAELDTFLCAVGGTRWRMTPAGTVTPPGLFHGYSYDTVGTRRGMENPTLPLGLLGAYRHIIWIVDRASSMETGPPASAASPMTTLRYMSGVNHANTLATWVQGGGALWAVGGGFGNASATWNDPANDANFVVYSSLGARPDLGPGQLMYDLGHWRSEYRSGLTTYRVDRAPFASAGALYAMLPAALRTKDLTSDAVPPYRTTGTFYQAGVPRAIEFLSQPNVIGEARNPSPRHQHDIQTLDTLLVASGAGLPAADPAGRVVNPVMTLYRGSENGPLVFTGVDLWSWSRADCAGLVDAVLQGQWGLARSGPGPALRAAARR